METNVSVIVQVKDKLVDDIENMLNDVKKINHVADDNMDEGTISDNTASGDDGTLNQADKEWWTSILNRERRTYTYSGRTDETGPYRCCCD